MDYLDDPSSEMTKIVVKPNQLVVLELAETLEFAHKCPDLYQDLIECSVFLNQRRVQSGRDPILALLLR